MENDLNPCLVNVSNPALPDAPAAPILPADQEPEPRAAAERIAAEMAALADDEVVRLHVDATAAAMAVLGQWPAMQTLQPAIDALSREEGARVARLREYALALYHWQSCVLMTTGRHDDVASLAEAGIAKRDAALTDLAALAQRGLIDAEILQNYKGSKSHLKLALDLNGLSALIRERWAVIEKRTLLTLDDADELARNGHALLEALGGRDRTPKAGSHLLSQRDRAFTLFLRAYQAARRNVSYLRYYEGDADEFVPAIYTQKRTARAKDDAPEAEPAAAVAATPAPEAPRSSLIVGSSLPTSGSPFEGA